jgi:branched-chain amino acid transport system permease protein
LEYLLHILTIIGLYVILSVSLNLLTGYTGLLSLAHAAFFGIGAYTAGLMAVNLHTPFLVNILGAAVLSGLLGMLLALPSLRVRDDYLAITTFAFQVMVFGLLNNWGALTGGPQGLNGIPRPTILGITIVSNAQFFILTACLCAITILISARLANAPFGRVLRTIREDEVFALSLGKNVAKYKITVFMLSASLAALAGSIYAYYIVSIDPTGFTIMESIFIIAILIIGGSGSILGPVVGAIILVTLPEILRSIGMPDALAANLRQIIYGGLLVIFMVWRPQGILGRYSLGSNSK